MHDTDTFDQVEITEGKYGHKIIKLNGKYLNSRIQPEKEAERQFANFNSQVHTGENPVVIVPGGGHGYFIHKVIDAHIPVIVWIEPYDEIFESVRSQLHYHYPLLSILYKDNADKKAASNKSRSETVLIRLKDVSSETDFDNQLSDFGLSSLNPASTFVYAHPPSLQHKTYQSIFETINEILNRKSVNQTTLNTFQKVWNSNIYRNINLLNKSLPLSAIPPAFRNRKCIIFGAGPSLTSHLDNLRNIIPESVLIAVDTAISTLTRAGFDPDFIISADPQAINAYHLAGYEGRAALVTDLSASPLVTQNFRNTIYLFENPLPLAGYFHKRFDFHPGSLAYGGSVSTNAYDLAKQLNAEAVILAGQDLAFSNTRVHSKGSRLEEAVSFKEYRLHRRETHNLNQRMALPPVKLPEFGKYTWTNQKMVIFANWFRRNIDREITCFLKTSGFQFSSNPEAIKDLFHSDNTSRPGNNTNSQKPDQANIVSETEVLKELIKGYKQLQSLLKTSLNNKNPDFSMIMDNEFTEIAGSSVQNSIQTILGQRGRISDEQIHTFITDLIDSCNFHLNRAIRNKKRLESAGYG